jgi:5'-nucleotidase
LQAQDVYAQGENIVKTGKLAPLAAALSLYAGCALAAPTPNAQIPVKLIAFNDYHGYIQATSSTITAPDPNDPTKTVKLPVGGSAYFATLVKQLQDENPLNAVVGAGDLIGASPLTSALFHDEGTIESLNRMHVDFSSVGNHEFDKGWKELRRIQTGGCYPGGQVGVDTCIIDGKFSGAQFKYLAANVRFNFLDLPLFPGHAVKKFRDGAGHTARVGFIGIVLEGTPGIVSPDGVAGLKFEDEATTINRQARRLRAEGVEAIVVLIHQGGFTTGLYNDQSCPGFSGDILPIVNKLDPAVDVVVSGHTHQAYICKAKARDGAKDILLTSAGNYSRFITDIDLTIDSKTKDVSSFTAKNIAVVNDLAPNPAPGAYPTLAKDAGQDALVTTYANLAAPLANKVIGSVTADITRTQNAAGESTLGDVIADAQLAATADSMHGSAVAAFMNPGGIRSDMIYAQISGGEGAGEITYGEAFNVQPFYNTLVTMTLTGDQLYTLLGQQWVGQTAPRMLQVSGGLSYTWDASLPDGSSKVVDHSVKINGLEVDRTASYRVTVNSFMAGGGDGFLVLKDGTGRLGGALDIDALTAYFGAHSPVAPGPQNRVSRLN